MRLYLGTENRLIFRVISAFCAFYGNFQALANRYKGLHLGVW
jgi:hypothetical protein